MVYGYYMTLRCVWRRPGAQALVIDLKLLHYLHICFNTLRPRQNGRYFPDDIFKRIFLNENVLISIKISLKFVPRVPMNNIPALVQIMAWRRPGDKPLSEPMIVSLPTHICVIRSQWVNRHHFTGWSAKYNITMKPHKSQMELWSIYLWWRNKQLNKISINRWH